MYVVTVNWVTLNLRLPRHTAYSNIRNTRTVTSTRVRLAHSLTNGVPVNSEAYCVPLTLSGTGSLSTPWWYTAAKVQDYYLAIGMVIRLQTVTLLAVQTGFTFKPPRDTLSITPLTPRLKRSRSQKHKVRRAANALFAISIDSKGGIGSVIQCLFNATTFAI